MTPQTVPTAAGAAALEDVGARESLPMCCSATLAWVALREEALTCAGCGARHPFARPPATPLPDDAPEPDERPGALPPEVERPSCVASVPDRPPCTLCTLAPAARRGVCWSCYAKYRECGVALPDREPAGRPPTPALRRWVESFDRPTLAQVRGWIEEILAQPPG